MSQCECWREKFRGRTRVVDIDGDTAKGSHDKITVMSCKECRLLKCSRIGPMVGARERDSRRACATSSCDINLGALHLIEHRTNRMDRKFRIATPSNLNRVLT